MGLAERKEAGPGLLTWHVIKGLPCPYRIYRLLNRPSPEVEYYDRLHYLLMDLCQWYQGEAEIGGEYCPGKYPEHQEAPYGPVGYGEDFCPGRRALGFLHGQFPGPLDIGYGGLILLDREFPGFYPKLLPFLLAHGLGQVFTRQPVNDSADGVCYQVSDDGGHLLPPFIDRAL